MWFRTRRSDLSPSFGQFSERASYYGTSGVFGNFIRLPLPEGGSGTGAVAKGPAGVNQSAGALGLGLQTSTALTQVFTFLAYTVPILGGIIADTKMSPKPAACPQTAPGADSCSFCTGDALGP